MRNRDYYTYKELSIGTGATYVVKVVSPVDFALEVGGCTIDNGGVRLSLVTGGTPGGTFSETLPKFLRDTMSDALGTQAQATITAGGTHTGGTEILLLRQISSGGLLDTNLTIGGAGARTLLLPAGTYHIRLASLSGILQTTTGVFFLAWSERS